VILIPLVDKAMRVDLREKYTEIPHQTCITKDNASISVDFLIYSKVVDPIASFVQVQDFDAAAEGIAVTTLRAVVGTSRWMMCWRSGRRSTTSSKPRWIR